MPLSRALDGALGPSGSQAANNLAVWRRSDTSGENGPGLLLCFPGCLTSAAGQSWRETRNEFLGVIEFCCEKSVAVLAKYGQPGHSSQRKKGRLDGHRSTPRSM